MNRTQNGAIAFGHESTVDLFHRLEERFPVCRPRLSTVCKWQGWQLKAAHLWLHKQTSLDRPSFMRRYR